MGVFGPEMEQEDNKSPQQPNSEPYYAIHEDLEEEKPENDLGYAKSYEEGYHRGVTSETGRVIQKDINDFYDKEHNQENYDKGGYQNNAYNNYVRHGQRGGHQDKKNLEQESDNSHQMTNRRIIPIAYHLF